MPDLILTEEEQMLQSTLRDFVDKEIAPKAKESDEKGEFQWENWEQVKMCRIVLHFYLPNKLLT